VSVVLSKLSFPMFFRESTLVASCIVVGVFKLVEVVFLCDLGSVLWVCLVRVCFMVIWVWKSGLCRFS